MSDNQVISPTDINILSHPFIFCGSETALLPEKTEGSLNQYRQLRESIADQPLHVARYIWKGAEIRVTGRDPLRPADRKTLIALEYLYYHKTAGRFESPSVEFAIEELAELLGIAPTNFDFIWNSIQRLYQNLVYFKVRVSVSDPSEEGLKQVMRELSLQSVPQIVEKTGGGPTVAEAWFESAILAGAGGIVAGSKSIVRVTFQPWHINNFRNKYYRLVNRSLYQNQKSPIAIAVLDYINYNGYYLNSKTGSYQQKKELRLPYSELCYMCGLTTYTKAHAIRKQLAPLSKLQEVGALNSWDLAHNTSSEGGFTVVFSLGSLGVHVSPRIVKKHSAYYAILMDLGLTSTQALECVDSRSEAYLNTKIEQANYVRKYKPSAYHSHSFSKYLYVSIRDDWVDSSYEDFVRREKLKPPAVDGVAKQMDLGIEIRQEDDELKEFGKSISVIRYAELRDLYMASLEKDIQKNTFISQPHDQQMNLVLHYAKSNNFS